MPRPGVVTIGQSPRTDMVPELRRWLSGAEIAERGALDGLTPAGAGRLGPDGPGDRLLVSRMRDGSSVKLCPDEDQAANSRARWAAVSDEPLVASASPYAPDSLAQVTAAAAALSGSGARFIILDCMGYDLAAREAAARASGLAALLAREVVAHLAAAALAAEGGHL